MKDIKAKIFVAVRQQQTVARGDTGDTGCDQGLRCDSEGFSLIWGSPQPPCLARGGGGSPYPTPQPCPGDDVPSGLRRGVSLSGSHRPARPRGRRRGGSAWEEGTGWLQPPHTRSTARSADTRAPAVRRVPWCPVPEAAGARCPRRRVAGGSGHTSEEERHCRSHAGAALASTRLVTGKSQPRSALPSVKWILAAPPLKQSRRSGAMAGALSHGSRLPGPRVNQPLPGPALGAPAPGKARRAHPCPDPPARLAGVRRGRRWALRAGAHGCAISPASLGSARRVHVEDKERL